MSCAPIAAGVDPTCDALKKPAGLNKRVWVGSTDDLATFTFDTDRSALTMTLDALATLKKFVGKKEKHGGTANLSPGDNVDMFDHAVNLVLYHSTQEERNAIEDLQLAEDLFVIVEENAGVLSVYGICNKAPYAYNGYGLSGTAGVNETGVAINDDNSSRLTLGGLVPNLPFQYKPLVALATNIAALDAMSV